MGGRPGLDELLPLDDAFGWLLGLSLNTGLMDFLLQATILDPTLLWFGDTAFVFAMMLFSLPITFVFVHAYNNGIVAYFTA